MQNLFRYDGLRVLVCGCYSGMGEATAKIVRSLGAEVVAADVKKPSFDFSAYLETDLRDPKAIEQMVAAAAKGGRIDRLFYCAGLPGTKPAVDVMGVNFIGLRHTAEQCVPHLPRGGAIASISSAAGMAYGMMQDKVGALLATNTPAEAREWVEKHQKEPWFEPYSFSKMCTILWTFRRGAKLTPATGIRLNCISPGPTDTPMMPDFEAATGGNPQFIDLFAQGLGRRSTPAEQAWPMIFLNSDAASYISGENLYTDGGTSAGLMMGTITLPFDMEAMAAQAMETLGES